MKLKLSPNMLLYGGIGLGIVAAWELNFLGIRDLFDRITSKADDMVSRQKYPFPYPYPPTQTQQTMGPRTLPGAHYQMAAGPPELPWSEARQPYLRFPYAAELPNPQLWIDKGGIVSPGSRAALPSAINYGPYKFEAPIFSSRRYPIYGTNLDYPFIVPPFCPPDQFQGQDGRCYPTPLYP
jgi:hypothetical protein